MDENMMVTDLELCAGESGALANFGERMNRVHNRFVSFEATSEEEKAVLFTALNSPTHRLSDKIGSVINLTNFIHEYVEITNKETGEVEIAPRIILIDDKGESYSAMSKSLETALLNLVGVYGYPTNWVAPLKLLVKQVTRGEKRYYVLERVVNK